MNAAAPEAPAPVRRTRETEAPIAHAAVKNREEILVDSFAHRIDHERLIQAALSRRKQLIDELKAEGLLVLAVKYKEDDKPRKDDEVFQDYSEVDDGGKLIESIARVRAFTPDQVKKIYDIAKRHNLGVMSIGAKTSAVGVFQEADRAKVRSFDGVLCVELEPCWNQGDSSEKAIEKRGMPKTKRDARGRDLEIKAPTDLLDLPKGISPDRIVRSTSHPIAVIKGAKKSERHRVVTHASVTVTQINTFLKEALPDDAHYQILPDLTSKDQAAIGGVIATGAQGGNRASARVDLLGCKMVDEYGIRDLNEEEAKSIVGYNGYTGTCVQATFEVTPFPRHDFGFLVPVQGKDAEQVIENALEIQARLTPYCAKMRKGKPPEGDKKSCITSAEILGDLPFDHGVSILTKGTGAKNELTSFRDRYKDCKMFVYVRGSTHFDVRTDEGKMDLMQEEFFTHALQTKGLEMTGEDLDLQDPDEKNPRPHAGVFPLFQVENNVLLDVVDKMRHSAPEEARLEAKKIGNVTQSTDFNIQFRGSAAAKKRGRKKVAQLYAKYQKVFEGGPFRVDIYGHLFPGMVSSPNGGGFDPHIRISLKLNDPQTRYNAPELWQKMKDELAGFYGELLKLNLKDGVVITPPEKSHLMIPKYVQYVRLRNPKEMRKIENKILGRKNGDKRKKKLTSGFRAPIEFPSEPTQGMLTFLSEDLLPSSDEADNLDAYSDAVSEISQLSHRGPLIKGMFREVVATIRESLKLDPYVQHPLFLASQHDAEYAIKRNLGDDHQFPVHTVSSPDELEAIRGKTDPDAFYIIPSEAFGGIPGSCILITPHQAIIEADDRRRTGQNVEAFRCFPDLLAQYPYEGPETPNITAIAFIGLALQQKELSEQDASAKKRIITMNPGPCGIDRRLRELVMKEGAFKRLSPDEQKKCLAYFIEFFKFPPASRLAMTGSSTECMQQLGQAMALNKDKVQAIQIKNDAFGDRLNSILRSHLGPDGVKTVTTPWTTSECTQAEFVVKGIVPMIREAMGSGKKPVLFVTPHKTSTTAHFEPSVLIEHLKQADPPLVAGKDYELVCDVTSGAGVVDYYGNENTKQGMSVFGSVQKGLGCPPGLGFVGLSEELQKLLCPEGQDSELVKCIARTEAGEVNNHFGIRMLGEKCRMENETGRTIDHVRAETRQKFLKVLGFMALHPDLCMQVSDSDDQSPLLVGMYSRKRNLSVAARLMEEIFGYCMGGGYGPFAGESLRLYLPSISLTDIDRFLHAFDYVLTRPEVTETVNKEAPLVSLREPPNPLVLLSRMRDEMKPDDMFENAVGLEWIVRLKHTYLLGKKTTYEEGSNLDFLKKLMDFKSPASGKSLHTFLYSPDFELESNMNALRSMLLKKEEPDFTKVDELIANIKRDLDVVVEILAQYASFASSAPMKDKMCTKDGSVIWPFAATMEQLPAAA